MKHKSCLYFDDVVNYLVNTHAQLRMEDLAMDLGMTTETMRRKRKGVSIPDCKEVEVLYRKYSINPMYFFGDRNILQQPKDTESFVSEPEVVYKTKLDSCKEENKLLREMIDMLKKNKK